MEICGWKYATIRVCIIRSRSGLTKSRCGPFSSTVRRFIAGSAPVTRWDLLLTGRRIGRLRYNAGSPKRRRSDSNEVAPGAAIVGAVASTAGASWRAPAGSGRFVESTLSVMLSLDCTIAHYQRLDLPVVGFCFRFSDYHKPSAVALAVAEGGRMGRPAHNSFALARCDAGTPSSV